MTKKTKGIFKTKQNNLTIVKVIGVCVTFTLSSLMFFQNTWELGLSCKELGDLLECQLYIVVVKLYLAESGWSDVGPVDALTCMYGCKGCNLHLYSKTFLPF